MGGARWFFLLWMIFCVILLGFTTSVLAQRGFSVCDIQGCNCTIKAAAWQIVNCSLQNRQVVNFAPSMIPKDAFEMYIFGGQEVIFSSKTFNALQAMTLIYVKGTRKIVMHKKSFYNITSSSLLIQIQNCDEIIIETGAFEYVESSVSTEIFDVLRVTIQQEAFGKLYNSTFKNVKEIKLHEKCFDFKNQGHIGRHGPVTVIIFDNVTIPEIPRETFLKPLASVSFRDSIIGDIQADAFKATEISAVTMIGTTMRRIKTGAFNDRTLICDLKISKCHISIMESMSVTAAIGNFTLNHSTIIDIEPQAITSTVAKVEVTGNDISDFKSRGFVFNNWNKIVINDNFIGRLRSKFVDASFGSDIDRFSFKGNTIHKMDDGALSFLAQLNNTVLMFDDNLFNQSCNCSTDWTTIVANDGQKIKLVTDTSYCAIDYFLSKCFSLPTGPISIRNFTEVFCANFSICTPKKVETDFLDSTSKIFLAEGDTNDDDDNNKQSWLIFMVTVVGLFILAIIVTFVILLVRGGRWLKEKGYFRNTHYANNDLSHDDEATVVTVDEDNDKLEIPEELTLEFLQILSKRLDDPVTHQEASEMIERLYEMFIVDDGYENNNRQEEEAHLYEELGNLNLQIPPPPYVEKVEEQEEEEQHFSNGARSILKLIEEKFNQPSTSDGEGRPKLMGEYSEPSDAAVHLYSELKNKIESSEMKESRSSLKSVGSNTLRPLPSKPIDEAGPSTKL